MASRGRRKQPQRFYVYAVYDGVVCLYVGKGCGSRHKQSARLKGGESSVIEWCNDEDHAYARERHWIAELMPTENRSPGGTGGRSSPLPLIPVSYRGKITEAEFKREDAAMRRQIAEIETVGPRRYTARMLLRFDLSPFLDASKIDAIRQVAHGSRC